MNVTKNKWTTEELKKDFRVISFLAPYVLVERRKDKKQGLMQFTHSPRVYFDFVADTEN